MAYCLRSFVETLKQVLNPHGHHKNWVLEDDKIPQFQSLFENAAFLLNFLDESSPLIHEKIATLEDQIMEAAEKAADTLEFHITSQILSSPEGQSFTISPPDLGDVIDVFEVAKQKLIKIKGAVQPSNHTVSPHVSSSRHQPSKNVVVGMEDDLKKLGTRLTSGGTNALDIIPIVGMGGMGKTTLARILYDKYSSTGSHFDCVAWVTVSQTYDPKQILQTLLDETVKSLSKMHEHAEPVTANSSNKMLEQKQKTVNSLNEKSEQKDKDENLVVALRKKLFSRRYLIVIDDIWSFKAWDDVQRAFPQNSPGSRIILTTRENTIVDYVKSKSHEMHLINKDDSWELIKGKVFGDQSCPEELEEVGKTIASSCRGLPLALQVIGGLLSESPRNSEFWDYVAKNVGSLIAKKDDQFSGIFSWSFAHLPHYLKPCFLYMGAFPEDHHIGASKVVKLWVSEGFLKPIGDKSLEEAAEIHLQALVDRNLIFVRAVKKKSMKAKSYGIHDLLRDLCLQKAQEKMFLNHVKYPEINNPQEDRLWFRRVSVHSSPKHLPSLKLTPHARSFLSIHVLSDKIISCLCFKLSLLRVLDIVGVKFLKFPELILQLANLRYLCLDSDIPGSITILRNLQTLIARSIGSIAVIADLQQLRHFIVNQEVDCCHNYRCPGDCCRFDLHENLQTLSKVSLRALIKLRGKLPNLRKLKIGKSLLDKESMDIFETVKCFYNLETLKCEFGYLTSFSQIPNPNFPDSLKKLTLSTFQFSQSLLDAIGMLPNLQILILESCKFESRDWETREGGFRELQYLHIKGVGSLTNLLATENDFPVLRHLVVESCNDLSEIPYEFGVIDTLERIDVVSCKSSVFDSARRILQEQRNFGNTFFQIYLGSKFELDKDHGLSLKSYIFTGDTTLPHLIRNLTLECCMVPQTLLSANDELLEFQLLNIECCHFESSTWETFEGVFFQLQYLKIVDSNLENWIATENHFPALRRLFIQDCRYLNEIPRDFGKIKTLDAIEVYGCKHSVYESARIILEEQRQFGNTCLQVLLGSKFEMDRNNGLSIKFYTFQSQTTLPHFLRYLSLECCRVPRTLLYANDEFPEFQVLNIEYCHFDSSTWDPFEGTFFQLQYLKIVETDLKSWLATEIHFPVLRHLVIRDCCHLTEIPNDFGKITTLDIIEVDGCKHSVFESARIILEEQRQFGNTRLQLRLGHAIDVWNSNEEKGESLISKVEENELSVYRYDHSSKTTFPQFLEKLTLRFCEVHQTILNAIGALPNIEVLKLTDCSFDSKDWEPFEGGFRELRYLNIDRVRNLANWLATETNFPVLQHLVLQDCSHLNKIPSEIGGNETLSIIEVARCKPSVFHSARRIKKRRILERQRKSYTKLQLLLGNEFEMDKSYRLSLLFYTFNSETILPHFLRNLTLEYCIVPKAILGANNDLPEFQVLNIENCRFESSTWEPFEGVFSQLQFLKIEDSNLENWLATEIHFPALRHLVIRGCRHLSEVPNFLGRVKTLEIINLDRCKHSVFESARIILEEQHKFGNTRLQLQLGRATDVWSFKEDEGVVEEEESLIRKVENHGLSLDGYNFSGKTTFPPSLKKLALKFCELPQTILNAIGALPGIQFLKISYCSFECPTWELTEDGFCQLQYLEIASSNLENWLAIGSDFPVLRHLIFYDCPNLNEIPFEIGYIHTLEIIEVDECKPSVFDSAKEILKEQRMYENNLLQLRLHKAIE